MISDVTRPVPRHPLCSPLLENTNTGNHYTNSDFAALRALGLRVQFPLLQFVLFKCLNVQGSVRLMKYCNFGTCRVASVNL